MDVVTVGAAKKYTDESISGAGALKGAPCEISSITEITGGNRVTFSWEDTSGVAHTSTMDVMNGEQGEQGEQGIQGETGATGATGKGIKNVAVNAYNHLICTYTDDTTVDAGEIDVDIPSQDYSTTEQVIGTWINGKPLYQKTYDFGALPNATTKDLQTGLTNCKARYMYAYCYNSTSGLMSNIPHNAISALVNQITLTCRENCTILRIQTGTDQRAVDECYITLQYTKNTD